MKSCISCGWEGEISTESEHKERKDFATYCPSCSRQTLEGDGEPI